MLALWWQVIINFIYWIVFSYSRVMNAQYAQYKLVTDHLVPFFVIIADWAINGIVAERSHLIPNLVPTCIYVLFNFILARYGDLDIYPGLLLTSRSAIWVTIISIPASFLVWFGLCWLTN